MEKSPINKQVELLTYEIYEESSYRDDNTLIWLCPEEESTKSDDQVEITKDLFLEHRSGITPDPAYPYSDKTHVQFLSPKISECDCSSVHIPIAADFQNTSQLTYKSLAQFKLPRWPFRVAALASVLLMGSLLPAILEHTQPTRAKASTALDGLSAKTHNADPQERGAVRVLTVMAGRQETIKDISIRYVGHFDDDLFEEICNLNPTLKDPNHLKDGQLIRIPWRPGHRATD